MRSSLSLRQREFNNISLIFFGTHCLVQALFKIPSFVLITLLFGRQEPADDRAGLPGPEDGESQPPAAAANTEPQPCQPPVTASDGGSDVEEELPMDEW